MGSNWFFGHLNILIVFASWMGVTHVIVAQVARSQWLGGVYRISKHRSSVLCVSYFTLRTPLQSDKELYKMYAALKILN